MFGTWKKIFGDKRLKELYALSLKAKTAEHLAPYLDLIAMNSDKAALHLVDNGPAWLAQMNGRLHTDFSLRQKQVVSPEAVMLYAGRNARKAAKKILREAYEALDSEAQQYYLKQRPGFEEVIYNRLQRMRAAAERMVETQVKNIPPLMAEPMVAYEQERVMIGQLEHMAEEYARKHTLRLEQSQTKALGSGKDGASR